jgi:CheY-like chemotaxis protein
LERSDFSTRVTIGRSWIFFTGFGRILGARGRRNPILIVLWKRSAVFRAFLIPNGTISMVQVILAVESVSAMKLGGVLLDNEDLNVQVVTDGRSLLDCLNGAPNFYHAVVMDYNLPEISGSECLTFFKQLHDRVCVLVLSDSLEPDRLEELARLGIPKKHVLAGDPDSKSFAAWVAFSLGEAGIS